VSVDREQDSVATHRDAGEPVTSGRGLEHFPGGELDAILERAAQAGIDPRRVTIALGVDPGRRARRS
jgi:hypothetical protein